MQDPIEKLKTSLRLTPELSAAFNHITTERTYRRGDSISEMSDLRNHLFYIMKGSARVYFISQGKEHTYSFAFENEFISLSFPLLNDSDYVTTIEFLESSNIAILPLEQIQPVLKKFEPSTSASIIRQLFRGLTQQMSALEERLLMMQTCSAQERYEWLINRYPIIFERAKLTQIASFLGITKETLYRIRSGKY